MKDKIKYITTDSLDAMIGDDYIKIAVFQKKNSQLNLIQYCNI